MIIAILALALTAGMFWSERFGSGYHPEPPRRPSKREQYIRAVDNSLKEKDYEHAIELIEQKKYPKEQLPIEYWRARLSERRDRIETEIEQLDLIKDLEAKLDE